MNNVLKVCLLGVGVAAVAIIIFKVPLNSVLLFGIILACPLMHVFMGHGGMHEDKKESETAHSHH